MPCLPLVTCGGHLVVNRGAVSLPEDWIRQDLHVSEGWGMHGHRVVPRKSS